ncbi:M14 family metallopeptidase [bacterium]|nr:M14 family metallopeptidase [bacterium]
MKNTIIAIVVIILVGLGVYAWQQNAIDKFGTGEKDDATADTGEPEQMKDMGAATTTPVDANKTVLGKSVEKRDITAYHYGMGTSTELLFIGGIHGGYEWNTVLAAYEAMDYLEKNKDVIPVNVKVTVIPVLNPDGLNKTIGKDGRFAVTDVPTGDKATIPGRFNAHEVDLNRNFDCDWKAEGTWNKTPVSGGEAAFSEPESQAMKSYIESHKLAAVVVWYSSAGGVFASNCHDGVLPETTKITDVYAKASGYPAHKSFNFYEITGDMVNWLAKEKIPAISVLLTNHTDTEWSKNQAGIDALLKYYAK